jgi:SOS-response transcriptional repressor LexA
VVEVNGGFTVKTYYKEHSRVFLLPANPDKELVTLQDTSPSTVVRLFVVAVGRGR